MKKTTYKIATFAFALVLTFSGCNKIEDFGNTNTNPAATNKPITSALLTNVLSNIGAYASNRPTALYCQFWSETQYPDVSCYSDNQTTPMSIYSANLYDLQNIIMNNTDEATKATAALNGANANQIAIARILKAYIFWTITDRWGDVPYSEALQGEPNVKYDTQESIYKDLIKELTESVAQFTSGAAIKGDIVFNGDIAKWKKLANSMRMLMALRLSKVYPGASDYAATQFKAALSDAAGSIATNADNFKLSYPGGNFKNPYYNMYDGRKDYGESLTMTDLLATLGNDPRLTVFGATVTGAASTQGVPYGRVRAFIDPWCGAHPDWCYVLHPDYRKENSPLNIIHAAAVLLARAEAADKGWTSENTSTLYTAGINAAFEMWGLTTPSGYLTDTNVALGTAGSNLKQIAIQEYLAWYPDGVQGWSNWRRTNYPTLVPAPDGTNSPKVIPRRFKYAGTSDYVLNPTGVAEAIARITGGDKMDSRVWWDK